MNTQVVHVFLNKDIKVGTLALHNKKIYFQYERDFLNLNINLSPYKLPLRKDVFVCEDIVFDGLFGVFADSLPDGWGRYLLDRHLVKSGLSLGSITPLDRLCYMGENTNGALSYKPEVKIETDKIKNLNLDILAKSSLDILSQKDEYFIDTFLSLGGSSAGARPKVTLQINNKNKLIFNDNNLQKDYEYYMVKFPSQYDDKNVGKLEYIYAQMAKDAGILMPKTKLLNGQNSYFATKRFDRVLEKRIHVHSIAGLTHSDFRFPSLDYDDLLSLAWHLTKDKNEQIKMFRLACFNLFTHNRDDHAKNFSFMLVKNEWKLTPAYDITFSYGPNGEHSTTYLGEGKNPTEEHLKALAKKHDINSTKIISEIKEVVQNFKNYAKMVRLDTRRTNEVFKNFVL